MPLSGRKMRCVCVVLAFVLVSVLGALTASNSLLNGAVLQFAAQAASASSNTTVLNNVSVLSDSVSLGSSLHVEGVVTTPKGPLASVPVTLHMGDITVARTQTDASGQYAFFAPVGLNYAPAVLSGSAKVYTVAEPTNTTFPAALSAVTSVPVNAVPVYVIAVVTGLVVVLLYVNVRLGKEGRRGVKTWTWTVTPPTSSPFTLTGETPTFIPDQIGVYQISLVVADTCGASSTNTVTVSGYEVSLVVIDNHDASSTNTVTVNKKAPITDAGPDHTDIHRGDTVTLDGSGSSDPDSAQAATSRPATLREWLSR